MKICLDINFVLGHHLFLKAHSLTDRFLEQIVSTDKYPSIFFTSNGSYCLYSAHPRKNAQMVVRWYYSVTIFLYISWLIENKQNVLGAFIFMLIEFSLFWSVFNKTVFPLVLVSCEMTISNAALCSLSAIYHLISNMR